MYSANIPHIFPISLRQKRNQDTKTVLTTSFKYTNVNQCWILSEQSGFGTSFVPKDLYTGPGKSLSRPEKKQANVFCQNGVNFLRRPGLQEKKNI